MPEGTQKLSAAPAAGAAPVDETAVRLRLAVTRLARRLRQEADAGVGPSMTSALATVERHGPLSPSRLAALERIQRPTAARLIRSLVEAGLVVREADATDGRVARVRASADGRRLVVRLRTR